MIRHTLYVGKILLSEGNRAMTIPHLDQASRSTIRNRTRRCAGCLAGPFETEDEPAINVTISAARGRRRGTEQLRAWTLLVNHPPLHRSPRDRMPRVRTACVLLATPSVPSRPQWMRYSRGPCTGPPARRRPRFARKGGGCPRTPGLKPRPPSPAEEVPRHYAGSGSVRASARGTFLQDNRPYAEMWEWFKSWPLFWSATDPF